MISKEILLSETYCLLTAGYGTAKGSPLVWSMPYSCPEFLATQKDLHMWFSSCATAERSQGDPVLVFGRGIAKALQCFANEIWSNGSEHSHKSIDDMVGSPEEARVLDVLVLFKAMDVACSFLHPTRSRPHHPGYNAMNLSQEELDVSHFPICILSGEVGAGLGQADVKYKIKSITTRVQNKHLNSSNLKMLKVRKSPGSWCYIWQEQIPTNTSYYHNQSVPVLYSILKTWGHLFCCNDIRVKRNDTCAFEC